MKDRILMWNDDNHEPCVWINNKFVGANLNTVIKNALYSRPQSETNNCEILEIYPWDFEEGEDKVKEPEADMLFDWFQKNPGFTEEQWNLIFEEKWKSLGKTL